jgi:ABC-type multidrug transport system ATPase subunit
VIALRAEGLTARYPGQPASAAALVDVDLEIQPGERLLLLGPNGAGKSTFIRVFAGLMRAAHGKALVGGQPAHGTRDRVGVVSHATYLYDELTAAENLRFYAELYLVPEPAARAATLLEQVGMARWAHVQVGHLSRGQQQRVAIARALLHDPPVLLLDEPDTGLDVAAFAQVEEMATAHPRTVVVTTHNLTTGLRLATRVAVLSGGRIVHEQASVSLADAMPLGNLLANLSQG